MNATKFAAYDDQAIWGTGNTAATALADVAQWVNPENVEATRAACKTAEMTTELAAAVATRGGDVAFGPLPDGRIGTYQQHYDAA